MNKIDKQKFNYADWYKKHRAERNRKRRERYQANPRVRRLVKEANDRWYSKVRPDRSHDRRVIKARGEQYFSIQVFSQKIKREQQTVREYHRSGILPQPTHFDTRGWRLYTKEQVLLAQNLFLQYDAGEITRQELTTQLKEGWNNGQTLEKHSGKNGGVDSKRGIRRGK